MISPSPASTHLQAHEDVVLLHGTRQRTLPGYRTCGTRAYLLISDRELALRLLVGVCERLEFLDGFILHDFDAEFDVAFGVLVTGLGRSVSEGLL